MSEPSAWSIEGLAKRHDRSNFSCGEMTLDDYLKKFASQNERLNVSRHYVAVCSSMSAVLGYYSLSSGSLEWEALPIVSRKKLPKYPVPVAHLGRLAVDQSVQGRRLGELLLLDALARVMRVATEIAVQAEWKS